MINKVSYDLQTADGPLHLTISPVNNLLPGGDFYSTGIYKLSNGTVGMGDIVFDEDMNNWTYDGMDELTYDEAAEVAGFIKNYKDPAGADPDLLQ
ncbi:hypothetical protein [Mucilaginibacter sp.]|uniref:hypothetical protein n=1 Tax=Mucilaginibacter sp. TaxID=1882438 RepID=UPI003D11E6E6